MTDVLLDLESTTRPGKGSIIEFVFRRFMIELSKQVSEDMGEKVPVVLTTNTDYVSPASGEVICSPPLDKQQEAILPAITITGIDISENRADYTAQPWRIRSQKQIGNEIFPGYDARNPSRTYDFDMSMRFFHDRMTKMFRLKRAYQRYLDAVPYLFIPKDLTDDKAERVGDVCALLEAYDCGEDISEFGFFLEQELPFTGPAFTSTSGSNNDNLYVCDTSASIKQVLLPDQVDLGFIADVQEAQIIIVEKDGDDIPMAIIDLEELNG